MAMAKVTRTVCDLCRTDKDVSPVRVRHDGADWELDVCPKCYKSRFHDLERLSHKPTRRPRRGFQVVTPLE